jgi:hypothetical protein
MKFNTEENDETKDLRVRIASNVYEFGCKAMVKDFDAKIRDMDQALDERLDPEVIAMHHEFVARLKKARECFL